MQVFQERHMYLKESFQALIKGRASEQQLIEFISSNISHHHNSTSQSNSLDARALQVFLELTLVLLEPEGCQAASARCRCCTVSTGAALGSRCCSGLQPANRAYEADDEGADQRHLFPCHLSFDDCHPAPVHTYHERTVAGSRGPSQQLIKHPRVCECILEFVLDNLAHSLANEQHQHNHLTTGCHLKAALQVIAKLNKVCTGERINCRALAGTRCLQMTLDCLLALIRAAPQEQHLYLEPMLGFALTLADYRLSGSHLKQLFAILKLDQVEQSSVLEQLDQLLSRQYRNLRNIQPLTSINFPTPAKVAEEIELDEYVSKSWHWRLRNKVVAYKRKRARIREAVATGSPQPTNAPVDDHSPPKETSGNSTSPQRHTGPQISPSWLECALMTPMSNISPLVHNGQVSFSCSMWLSVCGDLFVIDSSKPAAANGQCDLEALNKDKSGRIGFWARLTSGRRKRRRSSSSNYTNSPTKDAPSKRKAAAQRHSDADEGEEQEDEEEEDEEEEKMLRGTADEFRWFPNMASRRPRRPPVNATSPRLEADHHQRQPPRAFLGRRARDNAQEVLMHLVSFGIDATTIEIWLNIRNMTFCARSCRVTREGQSILLDQVNFSSHLASNGSWSHIVFCFEELTQGQQHQMSAHKAMSIRTIVNGVKEEKEKLNFSLHNTMYTNFACLIGCERSTYGYVWKLSQISIYKQHPSRELIVFLLGKGPDFWTISNFRQASNLPLADICQRSPRNLLNLDMLQLYRLVDTERALNWLTSNIQLAYVAHQPNHFIDYSSAPINSPVLSANGSSGGSLAQHLNNNAERFIQAKILNFSRCLKLNSNRGFAEALVEAGGIESVLVCFADVVRRNPIGVSSSNATSLAFSVLLWLVQSHQQHLNKFLDEMNGLKLVEFILVHPACSISKKMLDHYWNFVVIKKGPVHLLKSTRLIFHLMSCWRCWHKDLQVAKEFYRKLILLVKSTDSFRILTSDQRVLESYYISHNLETLLEAGAIDILMSILRECLVSMDEVAPAIDHETVELIVNLLSLLIKHPPGLDVMLDVVEFLLFLHPDNKAYIEIVPEKINFLAPLSEPVQDDLSMSPPDKRSNPLRSATDSAPGESNAMYEMSTRRHANSRLSRKYGYSQETLEESASELDEEEEDSSQFSESEWGGNLTDIIYQHNILLSTNAANKAQFEWPQTGANKSATDKQLSETGVPLDANTRCSPRNLTIANIADMLASIVKLILDEPKKVLAEALQKSILDPEKLILLANNESELVREKALRLFLYCIRACYSLNLKQLVASYEEDVKSSFKLCVPIQLMKNLLLNYPATMKMIQLCYGIIVGLDDFETIESVCVIFDIETLDNNLQLNAFILLINLMTQLQHPKDLVTTLRFVHAFLKQLLNLQRADIIGFLVEQDLIETLMKLYFCYMEHKISPNSQEEEEEEEAGAAAEDVEEDDYEQVKRELDLTIILLVRYFSEHLSSTSSRKSIEDLLSCFDLLNSYIPTKFHHLARDRKVMVLLVVLSYCRSYEKSARERGSIAGILSGLKSLLRKDRSSVFVNSLSDSQMDLDPLDGYSFSNNSSTGSLPSQNNNKTPAQVQLDHQEDSSGSGSSMEALDDGLTDECPATIGRFKKITETEVIERFKLLFNQSIRFILTREEGVIPSPSERGFIIKTLHLLASYISEHDQLLGRASGNRSHWSSILFKLEPHARSSFARLVLFLLSPGEWTNVDERKYFAVKLMDMFRPEQLLELLRSKSADSTYKLLGLFIRQLVSYNQPSESLSGEEDAEACELFDDKLIGDDTEDKLKLMVEYLDFRLDCRPPMGVGNLADQPGNLYHLRTLEAKVCDIWMSELAQIRQENSDRAVELLSKDTSFATGTPLHQMANDNSGQAGATVARLLADAIRVTRDVVADKHEHRKAYLEDLKQNKLYNYNVRQQWLSLIIGQSHERATWFLESHYPKSWELNPVEGPSRIRRRLRPCKLRLASRFRRQAYHKEQRNTACFTHDNTDEAISDDWFNHYCPHPLYSMVFSQGQALDSSELRTRMFSRDKISFNCDCSIIRANEVCLGEISIASWCIHFIGERLDNHHAIASPASQTPVHMAPGGMMQHPADTRTTNSSPNHGGPPRASPHLMTTRQSPKAQPLYYSTTVVEDLWFDEIVEIWDRRYQLQDVGLEIFLTNNMTYLLSFRSARDKDEFRQNLMRIQHKMINLQRFNLTTCLQKTSQLWRDGKLTNFDYLTCLNKLAGRSFNDLMQYPVFPFVLSNYDSTELDLEDPKNFRNLERPMAVQNKEKEMFYVSNYNYLHRSSNLSLNSLSKPYHYGNHYSNSATVLHFLVRLPPFTQMLIQYQDNNFDQPDRTFHSIASTWRLITRDSNTDFKELIPEFFFLPEMFVNFEQLELGRKQNDELVDDVHLPAWCPNSDPRLFTLIHRQALESRYVRENLNHWIDLVFGYKQTGKAAVEAINVFHPATYYGMINLNSDASTTSSSMSSTLATISARSSAKNSRTTVDLAQQNLHLHHHHQQYPNEAGSLKRLRSPVLPTKYQQVDIERLALETMIRTYGQMPRQLFCQPAKQQLSSNSSLKLATRSSIMAGLNGNHQPQQPTTSISTNGLVVSRSRIEPLKQVHGLKWGSYVGSPDGHEIKVVKHRKLVLDDNLVLSRDLAFAPCTTTSKSRPRIKLCLLPNGDIAIMKENTSLILDYRADRKSLGHQQPSFVSRKYFRRAGLSNIGRDMNLFSSMIISRQQFSYIDLNSLPTDSSHSNTSHTMSLALGPRSKFSPDSLSLVSWDHLDGTIRLKSSALTKSKASVPLVQGDFIVDSVSVCSSVPELNLLFVGYQSGTIGAHIVSSSVETTPIPTSYDSALATTNTLPMRDSKAAAASAIHFLHTTTANSSESAVGGVPLGPGRVQAGPTYSPVKLAGKTLQSVQTLNLTSRWLYCHTKPVTCIKFNVSFGVVVSGSEDGTLVIWDLNSLTYVRTLDFRLHSNHTARSNRSTNELQTDYLCTCAPAKQPSSGYSKPTSAATQQGCVCRIGVSLIASSDTLGDIVSTKDISSRMARASCDSVAAPEAGGDAVDRRREEDEDEQLSSILYCHTINGSLVGFVDCHAQVTALAYSAAPEGVSVNVIVAGLADGLIRMYSSWDLTRVQEFHLQHLSAPICSILYSRDNQLLYLAYQDSQVAVLRNKKVALAREWLL